MNSARQEHERKLRLLGLSVDLAGRSGFPIGDPRLDVMLKEREEKK